MKKLDFKFVNLKKQKPKKVKEGSITLHDKYFEYIAIFIASEPIDSEDEMGPWKDSITNLRSIVLKSAIHGIEKSYVEETDVWGIYLILNGFSNDLKIFFETEKETDEFLNKLKMWWLNE